MDNIGILSEYNASFRPASPSLRFREITLKVTPVRSVPPDSPALRANHCTNKPQFGWERSMPLPRSYPLQQVPPSTAFTFLKSFLHQTDPQSRLCRWDGPEAVASAGFSPPSVAERSIGWEGRARGETRAIGEVGFLADRPEESDKRCRVAHMKRSLRKGALLWVNKD